MHGVQEEIAGRYRTHKDDVIIGISSKGKEGEEKVRWRLVTKFQVIVNLRKEGGNDLEEKLRDTVESVQLTTCLKGASGL